MAHTISYNEDLHIMEIKVNGILDLRESRAIITEISQIGADRNCFLCLSDYREATLKLSTREIYDIPRRIAATIVARGSFASRFKRALVIAQDFEDFQFFETVTLNQGQNVKLFQDMDAAKKWLLET